MTRVETFEIPAVAPWLNANDRTHYQPKNATFQTWKHAAWLECRARFLPPFTTPVVVTMTVHKDHARNWDLDNLYATLKPILDGIVAAGLIPGDDIRYVHEVRIRVGPPRVPARLVLRIEAVS